MSKELSSAKLAGPDPMVRERAAVVSASTPIVVKMTRLEAWTVLRALARFEDDKHVSTWVADRMIGLLERRS